MATDSATTPSRAVPTPANRTTPRWLRESWVVLFAVYCIGFGIYGEAKYATFSREMSRVPVRPDVPAHYPLLAIHVLTGFIAICLAWCQVWPWLRETRPQLHRRLGWVYYLFGVFPSCLLAFPVAILTPAGQAVRSVLLVLAVMWTVTVVAGFRAILQHRYEDHRRWMLRNVALTTTIVTSRILSWWFVSWTDGLLPDTYEHQPLLTFTSMSATGLWTALLLHMSFVEWYLLRPRRRGGARKTKGAAAR
ncbi:DUF2306 domain-containing protein [Streptomyces sp. WELS2]|uniref:DUF2306 domain-containing protein n=1 Tax=Streptomyces sp. WELS2 TaxID=2749435 RepID=UPI0015F0E726|nr:DUF2306 domain-containing protein [Streptomyces sp. WELS2]